MLHPLKDSPIGSIQTSQRRALQLSRLMEASSDSQHPAHFELLRHGRSLDMVFERLLLSHEAEQDEQVLFPWLLQHHARSTREWIEECRRLRTLQGQLLARCRLAPVPERPELMSQLARWERQRMALKGLELLPVVASDSSSMAAVELGRRLTAFDARAAADGRLGRPLHVLNLLERRLAGERSPARSSRRSGVHRVALPGAAHRYARHWLLSSLVALLGCSAGGDDSDLFAPLAEIQSQQEEDASGDTPSSDDEGARQADGEAPPPGAGDGEGQEDAVAESGAPGEGELEADPGAVPADGVDLLLCPSYDDGFLPFVVGPVCGNCHGLRPGLPNFEPFASARVNCRAIGAEVASGRMPPRGGLAVDLGELVRRWVELGCPETPEAAATVCESPAPQDPPAPNEPDPEPPVTQITIDRARYDADDQELEVRGEVSNQEVTLVVEFDGRTESVVNDEGDFRETFTGVASPPAVVSVAASDGASATIRVEIDD